METHEAYYRRQMATKSRSKRVHATDAEVRDRLTRMVKRFGAGALEPFEVRLLAKLSS